MPASSGLQGLAGGSGAQALWARDNRRKRTNRTNQSLAITAKPTYPHKVGYVGDCAGNCDPLGCPGFLGSETYVPEPVPSFSSWQAPLWSDAGGGFAGPRRHPASFATVSEA